MSPCSPMRQAKTLASVPLPLAVPVYTITRYFITAKVQVNKEIPVPSIKLYGFFHIAEQSLRSVLVHGSQR